MMLAQNAQYMSYSYNKFPDGADQEEAFEPISKNTKYIDFKK